MQSLSSLTVCCELTCLRGCAGLEVAGCQSAAQTWLGLTRRWENQGTEAGSRAGRMSTLYGGAQAILTTSRQEWPQHRGERRRHWLEAVAAQTERAVEQRAGKVAAKQIGGQVRRLVPALAATLLPEVSANPAGARIARWDREVGPRGEDHAKSLAAVTRRSSAGRAGCAALAALRWLRRCPGRRRPTPTVAACHRLLPAHQLEYLLPLQSS